MLSFKYQECLLAALKLMRGICLKEIYAEYLFLKLG